MKNNIETPCVDLRPTPSGRFSMIIFIYNIYPGDLFTRIKLRGWIVFIYICHFKSCILNTYWSEVKCIQDPFIFLIILKTLILYGHCIWNLLWVFESIDVFTKIP